MPWLQITITTTQQYVARAEQLLLDLGASTVTLRDAADQAILEPLPGETPVWQQARVTGLFAADADEPQLQQQIDSAFSGIEHSCHSEALPDQDWTRAWMDHYQPMRFGERLWVCPHHVEPPQPEAINLRLDPGLAFGTGTHPTTALCLRWLDEHVSDQAYLLDYGCGSGILAIAALLLGVKQATGVDIDAQALQASRANAEVNQVSARLQLYTPEQCPQRQYPIVMANILQGPLLQLAPLLAARTEVGGDIVLSGLLRDQAGAVAKTYSEFFSLAPTRYEQDWALLHGRRKP